MDLSVFLAKSFGLYCLILAVLWIARPKELEAAIKAISSSNGLLALAGMLNLFIGLAIAIAHPIWKWDWRVAITILAYISIIKGICRIVFPESEKEIALKALEYKWASLVFLAVIGIFLSYFGFAHRP